MLALMVDDAGIDGWWCWQEGSGDDDSGGDDDDDDSGDDDDDDDGDGDNDDDSGDDDNHDDDDDGIDDDSDDHHSLFYRCDLGEVFWIITKAYQGIVYVMMSTVEVVQADWYYSIIMNRSSYVCMCMRHWVVLYS